MWWKQFEAMEKRNLGLLCIRIQGAVTTVIAPWKEWYMYCGVQYHDTCSTFCDYNMVENELHVLLHCNFYRDIRLNICEALFDY